MTGEGRGHDRTGRVIRGAGSGLLTALSVPPFGWWPLGIVGLGVLTAAVAGCRSRRGRAAVGFAHGIVHYGISLWWMTQFSLPGGLFVAWLQTMHVAAALALLVPSPGRAHTRRVGALVLAVPAAMVAADALRSLWPFGGLPLGGLDLGQAAGPLAGLVTWGGRLLLVGVTAALGACAWWATRRLLARRAVDASLAVVLRAPAAIALGLIAVARLAAVLPDGTRPVGELRIAVVQGGGPRGERATQATATRTYRAHYGATAGLRSDVDVILWPEDVFDVEHFDGSRIAAELARVARAHRAVLLPGGVEDVGSDGFRNFTAVFGADGRRGDDYQKVRLVPYGEFFWARRTIESLGLAQLPERDAVPGRRAGLLRTPAVTAAIAISYEGFFDDRTRGGVRAGGEVVLIPTNASSYRTAQVPSQQVAAARLRARETARWVAQAAPTGFSAILDDGGRLLARSAIGERALLVRTLDRRRGLTPYARWNDAPALVLAAAALAAALALSTADREGRRRGWVLARRRR